MAKRIKDLRLTIIAAPLVLLSPVIFTGKALFWGTPATQFVPWWDFAWKSILSGNSPFWNPLLGLGSPLAANYQTALFYPPTWIYFIVYLIGGIKLMAWMISVLVCGHLIWAGLGTAKLLEEIGTNKLGQTVGGLAFSLSGYLVARAGFLSINAAAAWIPWLLLLILRLAKRRSGSLIKLTAALAMLLLAGHAQTAFYGILLGGIWAFYWAVICARPGEKFANLGRVVGGYALTGLLAVGIGAIQLLPTAQYLMFSQRAAEYGYEQAMTYSFWPWRFLTLIMPNLFGSPAAGNYWGYGNFWEDAVYIGLVPFLLALGFVIRPSRKKNQISDKDSIGANGVGVFLAGIAVIGFILALGKNTPVFPFLYHNVPGADLFQAPTRHTILAELPLAILAGLGAHRLAKPAGKRLYFTRLAVAGCAAIIIGAVLTGTMVDDLKTTFFNAASWAGMIGMLAAILLLIMPSQEDKRRKLYWDWAIVGLVCLDLIRAGWGLNPGIDLDFYLPESDGGSGGRVWLPAEVEYELKFNRYLRFDTFQPGEDWEGMYEVKLPNLAMLQGVEMVNNFDPLVPGTYQAWMDEIDQNPPDQQILQMMDVSRIVLLSEEGKAGIQPVDHERTSFALAGCAKVTRPDELSPAAVLNSSENLLENLIILSQDEIECTPGFSGSLSVLQQKNGSILLQLDLNESGWIFWSQTWYPGWNYKIDGQKIGPTYRANYLFQAVPVPSDANQVELFYRPLTLIWGSVITGMSLAFLGVLSWKKWKSHG